MFTARARRPRALVDLRRDAEADAPRSSGVRQLRDRRRRARRAAPPATPSASDARRVRSTAPVGVDHAGEDLRPAEVDADDALAVHGRWLPYSPGWPARTSPTASTGAGASRARSRRPAKPRVRRRRTGATAAHGRARCRGASRAGRPPAAVEAGARRIVIGVARPPRPARRLGVTGFLAFRERRLRREQAARPRARQRRARRRRTGSCSPIRRRSCCSARTTPTAAGRERRPATPTRSCSSAPTRRTTGSPTSRSRATCSCRARARQHEDQRRVSSSAAPRSRSGRSSAFTGLKIDHVVDRRLQQLQGSDRRERRRSTINVPGADPLEPLRLPVPDRRRAASSGRAGASAKGRST